MNCGGRRPLSEFDRLKEEKEQMQRDLERIRIYCQKDTLTVAQLLLKYKGKDLIIEENIEFV